MPIPTATMQDAFIRFTLQCQAEFKDGFDRYIPVSKIVDHFPEWRESDNRPVPGYVFMSCVEALAKLSLLDFDMDSKPEWDLQTTRVKLTPTGVYQAMLHDKV